MSIKMKAALVLASAIKENLRASEISKKLKTNLKNLPSPIKTTTPI